MFFKPYSIGSSGSKKLNFSILKVFFKGSDIKPLFIVEIDGDITLSLKNIVAKLAITLIIMISIIFAFSLEILF